MDIGHGEGDGERVGKGEDGCLERNERAYALSFRCVSVVVAPWLRLGRGTAVGCRRGEQREGGWQRGG